MKFEQEWTYSKDISIMIREDVFEEVPNVLKVVVCDGNVIFITINGMASYAASQWILFNTQ